MNPIAALYRLQEIDTTWDKIRRRILQLQKFSGGSPELVRARERVQAVDAELQKTRKEQQDAEMESASLSERIIESDKLLMGGQVRSPKELEALQSNLESMRRHKGGLDDRSVEAMVKADEIARRLAEQSKELNSQESEWQAKEQAIEEELVKRKKEYLYLKTLREQAIATIEGKLLEQYEYLRGRKNGVAVAKLDNDTCTACHMQVPVGVIAHVRQGDGLVSCTACGRILFAE
ncbi:MAG: hypothetical protein KJZ86_12235 [Caldilineaceae bacterium]|nr:hypothetical protein [Caldilineaceae bacterium]HRJ41954.1 C4-type zinc ribbon domain-containing protein [Caldilineaceae bacterium]